MKLRNFIRSIRIRLGYKPGECPYCKSSDVSAHAGYWECHNCGQSGSY
jgi:ribosomal protein L37AE/L43A